MAATENAYRIAELARYQNPNTKEWWRIVRDGNSSDCWLESISQCSLERELCWAFACMLTIELAERVDEARVRTEMEAYLAIGAIAGVADPAAQHLAACSTCQDFDKPSERYQESAYRDLAGHQVECIFAMLDAAKALGGALSLSIHATAYEPGIAEHAVRLWASGHGIAIRDVRHVTNEVESRWLELAFDPAGAVRVNVHLPPRALTIEPAPGVVIELPRTERDAEQLWRPEDGAR